MNFKSILLGTAAGLMGVSVASAADLPGEVPSAVDYVKVCDTFGAGFFYIPGTETCLDISGRVRFTTRYTATEGDDAYTWTADGRVDFDARNSTEYGQLRSFFRIASDDRAIVLDAAYIQLSYLTVGYMGSLWNGDVLYGIDDGGNGIGDQVGIQVLVDDLGGGFYVGAALEGINSTAETDFLGTVDSMPDVVIKAGIDGQPWGSINASFLYSDTYEVGVFDDAWGAKLYGEFVITEGFTVRASATYFDNVLSDDANDDAIQVALAGAMAVSDAATVYAGVRYDVDDPTPDDLYANIGVDYTITDGLIATGELSYADLNEVESFSVIGRLTRNW